MNVEAPWTCTRGQGKDGNTLMETDEHAAVVRRLYRAFFGEGCVGKIVEEWEIFDVLGLYRQLGLAPPPA